MKTTENTKKAYLAPSIEVMGVVMCSLLLDISSYDKDTDETIKGEESLGKHHTSWGKSGMWDEEK